MFMPQDDNTQYDFLDNINRLLGTGSNVVSLINGLKGMGTNNPYYYPQFPSSIQLNLPQNQQLPNQQLPQQIPQQQGFGSMGNLQQLGQRFGRFQ